MNTARQRFAELHQRWIDDTWMHSSPARILDHPAALELRDWGKVEPEVVVPLILEEYDRRIGFWHHLLSYITGVKITDGIQPATAPDGQPIPGWSAVNMGELRDAWVQWGRDDGYTWPQVQRVD